MLRRNLAIAGAVVGTFLGANLAIEFSSARNALYVENDGSKTWIVRAIDTWTGRPVGTWSVPPGAIAKLYDDLMPEWWWPPERGRYHDLVAEVLRPNSCQLVSRNPSSRGWSLQVIDRAGVIVEADSGSISSALPTVTAVAQPTSDPCRGAAIP
jgi:hypothetical protein